ncbi:hypothetical protein NCC49_004524 [Naganishia albida]|nr:hypothetical protein NCC49_004524 [Naganishia albida]
MLASGITASLLVYLAAVGRASPIARDNDGVSPKPISWTAPEGERLCWQPDGERPSAGQTLVVATCQSGSPTQQFIFNTGPTSIRLAETNLCVEFGPGLGRNGTPLRLQECRSNGAPGQRLFITDDDHVALRQGPGQCADVTDGRVVDGRGELQSWRCAADNANQIFSFEEVPPQPEPEPVLPLGAIQWDGNDSLCWTVAEPGFESGVLDLETCGSVPADRQRFWLPPSNRGNITLQDNSTGAVYCADLGVPFQPYPPLNGTPIFFAACDVSRIAPQQNFLVIETIVGSVDNVSYIFQNVPSTSFIAAVEDNQAASGYTVQTRAEFSGLDPWGYFLYPAPPAEPNPNRPPEDD